MLPRVLFAGSNDWANCVGRVARAMRAAGGEARVWTLNAHPFGYAEDVTGPEPTAELRAWCEQRAPDWLLTTGDGGVHHTVRMREMLGLRAPDAGGPRIATLQVGSFCRADPVAAREADETFGSEVRFVGADLLRFYRDDERAVPFLAPCEGVVARIDHDLRDVAHSPSNRSAKGTDHILPILVEACERAHVGFDLIEDVAAPEARARRARCAIFVDQFNYHVGGFGQSVTEALADGCAVVSHVAHLIPELDAFYPRPPILHVRDENALRAHLTRLLADPFERAWRRRASLAWATEVASPRAVAEYWWRHLAAA